MNITCPLLLTVLFAATAPAQVFNERFTDWPIDLKIGGRIIVAELIVPDGDLAKLLSKESKASAMVISSDLDSITSKREYAELFESLDTMQLADVPQAHSMANQAELMRPATAIWEESSNASFDHLDQLADYFHTIIESGGTVIAIGPQASRLGAFSIIDSRFGQPLIEPGMNLLPDCVLAFNHPSATADSIAKGTNQAALQSVLAAHPRLVGISLSSETALLLDGRKFRVAGSGEATFLLAANDRVPIRVANIAELNSRREPVESGLLDLTQWRRDAIDRTLERFPNSDRETPIVENGTLVIVGGGGMPDGLMSRFVEYAGGVEHAKLVYIPCEESDSVAEMQSMVEMWRRMGVREATFIHTKDRKRANDDQEFLQPLREATGIWFGGGRQWNFADSYYGTTAHRLMKEVLDRGGVIGGSSAGASIQARYLARATPINNTNIMAFGYERGGLGFISGVAIDQHFSQRGRFTDMTQLMDHYPQLLGIGLDEATALIVEKSHAEVVGRGKVYFYDRSLPVAADQPDYTALEAGEAYDLTNRKPIVRLQ